MCGIVGAYNAPNASEVLQLMLYYLQHRGQESAGEVTTGDGAEGRFHEHQGDGLVNDIFTEEVLASLLGNRGIGHNRYPTQEGSLIQPIGREVGGEKWYVVHNGNLINDWSGFDFKIDTQLILHNLCLTDSSLPVHERIYAALENINGAFSLLILHQDKEGRDTLIAVRDPQGFRPLCMAQYNGGYLFASESCAFSAIESAIFSRHIQPGEILCVNSEGLYSYKPEAWQGQEKSRCIFELVYFCRPDSRVETAESVREDVFLGQVQEEMGAQLARENPDFKADVLLPVPQSALRHGAGFARENGDILLDSGITRSHYGGRRTFIDGGTDRLQKILKKFIFIIYIIFGKRIALLSDSIVRSSTMMTMIKAMRQVVGKITSITLLIASPPVKFPCFYGIFVPKRDELAFNKHGGADGTRDHVGADDLRYLSKYGMCEAVCKKTGFKPSDYCTACFTGNFPLCAKIDNPEYRKEAGLSD